MKKCTNLSFVLFALIYLCYSCKNAHVSAAPTQKRSMEKTVNTTNKNQMTGHIVEKSFHTKMGKNTGKKELYFRASIQDYYIKFCESDITPKELAPFIDKAVTVEANIKNGSLDICEEDEINKQSRIGDYMVIKSIVN